jgi:hypothetical protein
MAAADYMEEDGDEAGPHSSGSSSEEEEKPAKPWFVFFQSLHSQSGLISKFRIQNFSFCLLARAQARFQLKWLNKLQ